MFPGFPPPPRPKSSPLWTLNHILIPDLVPEVRERSRALIGQGGANEKSSPPSSWTDYEEWPSWEVGGAAARVRGQGGGLAGGKNYKAICSFVLQSRCRAAPPNASEWPGGSVLAIPPPAGAKPHLRPFPEPAAPPSCPAVSPGFKLHCFVPRPSHPNRGQSYRFGLSNAAPTHPTPSHPTPTYFFFCFFAGPWPPPPTSQNDSSLSLTDCAAGPSVF